MASKDWKLPDAQHKITEEKGLDIENESIQRQWEKTIVSFIRLEDAFSDIDVYDDTEEGEIPYRQYLMRRWLFIHQDKNKNETLKDEDKKKVNTDTFYISQKLSNSTGNSILDVLNDAFSDGSSEWVGYKGGFFSYNDDACVLVTAKGMSFSESGDYSLTYVESGKTTTLTDSRGFEQEADIYYAYNTDEFSEAYENLNTVDNEIADESSLIFEFLIGNENYTDWQ